MLNRPELVSATTRAKVEHAMESLGFVRNESARQLRAGSSRIVAYLMLDAGNPFFTGTMWENVSSSDGTPGLGAGASLSHGWSTAPTSALSAYVLGVQPATAGYATWTVQPHPGDLAWSQGRVPTPHGDLNVKWAHRSPSALEIPGANLIFDALGA